MNICRGALRFAPWRMWGALATRRSTRPAGMRKAAGMPPQRKSTPRSPDHAALARAIELLIAEDAEMSQQTVAEESGLNIRQVNALIRGQANPTYESLLRLCVGLHVPLGELLTLADGLRD